MRNKSKNKASYHICQKPSKSLWKEDVQKTGWSPKHIYQEYFKSKVCLKTL